MNRKDVVPQPSSLPICGINADTSDLKQRLTDTRANESQNIIDEAVDQWRTWLHACKTVKVRHFEHLLN